MNFVNNTERMAFEKSVWPFVEISEDGKTIYKGRPTDETVKSSDPNWYIQKIEIHSDRNTVITTALAYPYGRAIWSSKESAEYRFI